MNIRPKQNIIIWATRIGILMLTLCAGILFPPYLLWYYKARFGIRYP